MKVDEKTKVKSTVKGRKAAKGKVKAAIKSKSK